MIDMTRDMPERATLMTPAAAAIHQARVANNLRDNPAIRCLPLGVPRLDSYTHPFKIVQTPGLVLVLYESQTLFRQIFTDGRRLPEDPQPAWLGYSVGRWEGDTLVVQTAGFTDQTWLDGSGHPHSEAMRLTERFTRRDVGHARHRGDDRRSRVVHAADHLHAAAVAAGRRRAHRVHLQREPRGEPAADEAEALSGFGVGPGIRAPLSRSPGRWRSPAPARRTSTSRRQRAGSPASRRPPGTAAASSAPSSEATIWTNVVGPFSRAVRMLRLRRFGPAIAHDAGGGHPDRPDLPEGQVADHPHHAGHRDGVVQRAGLEPDPPAGVARAVDADFLRAIRRIHEDARRQVRVQVLGAAAAGSRRPPGRGRAHRHVRPPASSSS